MKDCTCTPYYWCTHCQVLRQQRVAMDLPEDFGTANTGTWPDHPAGTASTLDKATFVATMLNHTFRNWQDVFDYLTNKGYKVVKQ